MDTQRTSRAKYFIIFFISLIAEILIIFFRPEAFWVPLPFGLTALALGFDWL
jgi:hypothetical protein